MAELPTQEPESQDESTQASNAELAPESVFDTELLSKREALLQDGGEAYPYRFEITHTLSQIREMFEEGDPSGKSESKGVSLAGRIGAVREMGKAWFMDLVDFDNRLQIYLKKNVVGEESWERIKLLDLGDWMGLRVMYSGLVPVS